MIQARTKEYSFAFQLGCTLCHDYIYYVVKGASQLDIAMLSILFCKCMTVSRPLTLIQVAQTNPEQPSPFGALLVFVLIISDVYAH